MIIFRSLTVSLLVFSAAIVSPALARSRILHVVDLTESGAKAAREPKPFDESADAMADVDAALARASNQNRLALVILGGNWCHDSRALAMKFEDPRLAQIIADRYEVVWVDVGFRDRNLDVAKRFGFTEIRSTPTVLVLSGGGELQNGKSAEDWNDAASKPIEEIIDYFRAFPGRGV